jgi:hypothetical protein
VVVCDDPGHADRVPRAGAVHVITSRGRLTGIDMCTS